MLRTAALLSLIVGCGGSEKPADPSAEPTNSAGGVALADLPAGRSPSVDAMWFISREKQVGVLDAQGFQALPEPIEATFISTRDGALPILRGEPGAPWFIWPGKYVEIQGADRLANPFEHGGSVWAIRAAQIADVPALVRVTKDNQLEEHSLAEIGAIVGSPASAMGGPGDLITATAGSTWGQWDGEKWTKGTVDVPEGAFLSVISAVEDAAYLRVSMPGEKQPVAVYELRNRRTNKVRGPNFPPPPRRNGPRSIPVQVTEDDGSMRAMSYRMGTRWWANDAAGRLWGLSNQGIQIYSPDSSAFWTPNSFADFHFVPFRLAISNSGLAELPAANPKLVNVTGKVQRADGSPFAMAELVACQGVLRNANTLNPCMGRGFSVSTTTGADGEFSLADMPPAGWVAFVRGEGKEWFTLGKAACCMEAHKPEQDWGTITVE